MKTVRLIVLIVQRVLITAGVFFTAAVVIHFTAIDPKERAISCDRACNRADWPRICRFELVVEKRTFRRDRAAVATDNVSLAAGERKRSDVIAYYTINGRYVGPTLTVCENDFLVVDVENRIPGESIALHWTGQSQRRTPFMDGVPMITQCPIASFTRFQYKFQADRAGSHLYHGFTGAERTEGLIGAFIVRSAFEQKQSPIFSKFGNETVWLITALNGLLAVNGERGWQQTLPFNWTNRARVDLLRVRLLYAVGHCQHWLELEDHELQVLALDGNALGSPDGATTPVNRILLHDGLRMDLSIRRRPVVPAVDDKIRPAYGIRLTPAVAGSGCEQAVFRLRYDNLLPHDQPMPLETGGGAASVRDALIPPATPRTLDLSGSFCSGVAKVLCPQELHGQANLFPAELAAYDARLEFTIDVRTVDGEGPFGEPGQETVRSVNGFTFAFPSVLMLGEPANDELQAHTCGGHRSLPRSCHPLMGRCECVHVEHIEAGHRVEMVLINADPAADYVYHLHGHGVFVVGTATGHRSSPGKVVRNLRTPQQRDTIVVQRDSIVVVRFVAKNAGLWLLREIGSSSWSRGLDVVLNVGAHPMDFDMPNLDN
uniref:Plastocyanin-like domain-containing protein n=1 Tax=Anopheles farauti TaxID=69004 RepID=A0A182QAP5_9DIPT